MPPHSLITSFNLSQFLSHCDLTFSHSCECKNNRPRQGAGKGGWKEKEGMEKQGLLPCIVLLLIPPLLHTKTFDTFQWRSPTLPVTPTHSGLHKLTQHGSTHSHAHRFKVFPRSVHSACQTAWNLPFIGGWGSPLLHPRFSFLLAFIHSPWLRPPLGPHKAFVQIDGLWLAWK